mgnify:CR=1 FL=1|tara:strand:- start:59 stop:649 length:591 start_codon:yes stop_codon:yes gene_type:complete
MNALKKIFFIVIFINFVNFSYAQDPSEFISDITNTASEILKENITTEAKADKLIIIAERSVDIDGIGLYSLGKHRKSINKDQLERYKKTFREYFLKSFSSRLSQYSDPKINVLSENVINEKYTIVSSILIETADRPEIKIDWRVYTKDPNNPLVRDLIIEGLSLARTQREEFNSIIQSEDGDISALFKNLEEFNQK